MGFGVGSVAGVVLRYPVRIALGLGPALVTGVVLAHFITSGAWQVMGIWTEPSVIGWSTGFADLANQTATADCMRGGLDVTTCDPYGRPFQPYAIIPAGIFTVTGIGVAQTGVLGIALAAVYTLVIAGLGVVIALTWHRAWFTLTIVLGALTLAAISPPALLIVERGQIEILILACATFGLAAVSVPKPLPRAVGTAALVISVILKYFNIGVFAAFGAPRRWTWWAAIGIALSGAFLILNLGDVQLAAGAAGSDKASTSRVMFGSTTLMVTLAVQDPAAFTAPEDQVLPLGVYRIIGVGLLMIFTAAWWVIIRAQGSIADMPSISWYWIVGSAGAVGVPYLLGGSNDYRLVLLLPAFAGVTIWLGRGGPAAILAPVLALAVLVMATNAWMIPNTYGWDMPRYAVIAGELGLSAVLAFGAAVFLHGWSRNTERSSHQNP